MKLIKTLKPDNLPATIFTLVLAALSSYLIQIAQPKMPPLVPLWYSNSWGESRLAPAAFLWVLPLFIVLFLLLNQLLCKLLLQKWPLLVQLVTWSCALVAILLTYSLFKILSSVV